ncbi:HK97 gp10 family phage protein (plasmid) [Paraclostridium ghonii]|uniref:HK97 gp10 family phage protein n=1 Tax=Paraclostridium ghonii TaxID=29358 RepID=UPI00202CC3CD|nr:HK97 gp10 family phage protein [Paeniclostridium ghonii]MCM0167595.1 HK97 gp10 family phage protein [Paeniclostridium ghonii]
MDILGFASMMKSMNNASSGFDNAAKTLLNRVGTKFLRKVKLKTPVDTGYLRRSWDMEEAHFRVVIGTNVKYATPIEEGHRTRSGGFVEGKHMLKTTIEEIETEMEKEFDNMLKILWK